MAIHKFLAFGQQDICRSGTVSANTQVFVRSVNKISVVRSHKFPSFGQYVLWKSFIAQRLHSCKFHGVGPASGIQKLVDKEN